MIDNLDDAIAQVDFEITKRKVQDSYLEYVVATNKDQKYVASKFHTFLCNSIQKFMEKDDNPAFDILLLSVPPQFGKSTTVTETLPSWYLGKNPDKKVIICGYNEDFAIRFGRRNKEKIEEYASKFFPDCKLADSPCSNVEFETTKKGRCISRGIMSGLTGNTADLFIVDDPIKNRQEADSETTRKAPAINIIKIAK